ncbi:hypothetical protein Alches_16310 [Alicyclobacillus hesperidum subsp. aegles]|uniref:hypothetical protein n=1 Tax=Alicyclobacillus hesperidum TaxID=89784 RepID=UPI00222A2E26|nr:hypothetical protein [Alicyclobacillus hesperidum]GLG01591.1 hypothetical protein Alches_16310 [Alicyclobacillus hesperidum subsp. aegles]
MIYRKLSPTGDYTFGQQNEFYSGTDAVAQAIYTNLKLLQGEWWEDTSAGFPLFQSVLDQPGSPEHIRGVDMLVQETILNVPNVQAISNFSSAYDNTTRRYTIETCTVETTFGDVTVEGVTFGP